MLFCTKTDPGHKKQPREVIVSTAEEFLGGWDMRIRTKLVNVDYPVPGLIYRAHESLNGVSSLHLIDGPPSSIPSFDTRTGEEISVPAPYMVPEPVDHPTYILQWICIGSTKLIVFFDRGASFNLIQGSIAEREGLHRISSNPGKLRAGGGMEINTVFGIYKVHLGPTDSGEYLEVTCPGTPGTDRGVL